MVERKAGQTEIRWVVVWVAVMVGQSDKMTVGSEVEELAEMSVLTSVAALVVR